LKNIVYKNKYKKEKYGTKLGVWTALGALVYTFFWFMKSMIMIRVMK